MVRCENLPTQCLQHPASTGSFQHLTLMMKCIERSMRTCSPSIISIHACHDLFRSAHHAPDAHLLNHAKEILRTKWMVIQAVTSCCFPNTREFISLDQKEKFNKSSAQLAVYDLSQSPQSSTGIAADRVLFMPNNWQNLQEMCFLVESLFVKFQQTLQASCQLLCSFIYSTSLLPTAR